MNREQLYLATLHLLADNAERVLVGIREGGLDSYRFQVNLIESAIANLKIAESE
jgi:hypothetical protein